MSTQLNEYINNSILSKEDKEDFIFFLENISDEESNQLDILFSKDVSQIAPFWTNLKEKLIFTELLDNNTDFSDTAKEDIKKQISKMTPEEFTEFLNAIQKIADGGDITKEMNSLLEQSQTNTKELSTLTNNLISK